MGWLFCFQRKTTKGVFMFFPEDIPRIKELHDGAQEVLRRGVQQNPICPICNDEMRAFVRLGQIIKYYCPRSFSHSTPTSPANESEIDLTM
jgi:hypothetical protein